MQYKMLREAPVTAKVSRDDNGKTVVDATIAGKYEHRFPAGSRVCKAAEAMTERDLTDRLSGGHFFFVEDNLVDFRYASYNGFVHSDQSIDQLFDTIGVTGQNSSSSVRNHNQQKGKYVLGSKWSNHDIQVPGYHEGGEFTSQLNYNWSPFHRNVGTSFMLTRLICENGMVGLGNFLNAKIPLINRWKEHLEIANRQIQNKVETRVRERLAEMGKQRATVGELGLITQHAHKRLHHESNDQVLQRLSGIMEVCDPSIHLNNVYSTTVFNDKQMAAQLPGHMTVFDAYNLATELRTWTNENDKSSDHALDRFTNTLVFGRKDPLAHIKQSMLPAKDSFSDADAAFFGASA